MAQKKRRLECCRKKNRRLIEFETRPSPFDDARTNGRTNGRTHARTMNDANAPEGDAPKNPREEPAEELPRHEVRHTIQVVGMKHVDNWEAYEDLWNAHGRELRFVPQTAEFRNQVDLNAIAVYPEQSGIRIGWVPADIARKVAPLVRLGQLEIKSPGVVVGVTHNRKCIFVDVGLEFNLEEMSQEDVERFMNELRQPVRYNNR
jgi:hypothetical protein